MKLYSTLSKQCLDMVVGLLHIGVLKKGGKMRLLRVVYEETETKTLVITTYLTSQVARYWKEKKGEN